MKSKEKKKTIHCPLCDGAGECPEKDHTLIMREFESETELNLFGGLVERLRDLPPIETKIATMLINRLHAGLIQYGAFEARDVRDFRKEVLEEVIDAQIYSARLLISLRP